jgi:hypothetical protein
MKTSTSVFVAGAGLVSIQLIGLALHGRETAVIEPHAQTQRLLTEYFRSSRKSDPAEHWRRFDELDRLAREDYARFVQQGILAHVKHDLGGDLGVYVLFEQVGTTEGAYMVALSTLLYSDDARLRREAWDLFPRTLEARSLRGRCANGQPDVSDFRTYVTGPYQKPEIATPLKRAIFEKMPSAAFLMYVTSEGRDEGIAYLRKERVIDDALFEKRIGGLPGGKVDEKTAATLRELGQDEHWWARMFAAETMVQHKEFRDAELIAKLLNDENELVRESVASIENPDPLRASPVDP